MSQPFKPSDALFRYPTLVQFYLSYPLPFPS
ncbi:CRISPR-associated protein Cas5 [Paenibacillaceae bacterium]|nr:CRISPR-associated protein Cas5 [Paenibacillaceae bacterium]